MNFNLLIVLFIIIPAVKPVCLGNRPIGDWIDFEWGDKIPPYAVKGGHDQTTPLYICRAANHTLKLKYCGKTSRFGRCWVDHLGKEKAFKKFQILSGVNGFWVPIFSKKDRIPCNSLRITEVNGKDIYSGRQYDHSTRTLNLGAIIDSLLYLTYEEELSYHERDFEIFTALPRHLVLKANESSKPYIPDGNFISFRVKRKEDITFLLGPSGKELFYEIIFPIESHRFEFKDHRLGIERTHYYNDYKTSEFEHFWIYFRNNIIRIGIEGSKHYMNIDTEDDADIGIFKFMSTGSSVWYLPYFEDCK